MSGTRTMFACLLAAATFATQAEAQGQRSLAEVLAEIDRGFICPEFQPSDEARRAELMEFSRALASAGPTRITYRKAAYIRSRMLLRHNCGGTGAVAAAERAEPAAAQGAAN